MCDHADMKRMVHPVAGSGAFKAKKPLRGRYALGRLLRAPPH